MPRQINSAVITGATGAIGTALCHCLADKGIEVYAVVRPSSSRIEHLKNIDHVHLVCADMNSLLPLFMVTNKADAFFHLAWAGTTGNGRNDMLTQTKNISYTLMATVTASMLGCKVFVGAGSQAEYGRKDKPLTGDMPCDPENGYGIAKLCAGQMSRIECEKYGIDHIWTRILSVYGPYDGKNAMIPQLIEKLRRKESPEMTPCEQIWDYMYSGDAAEALYHLAESGVSGKVYPLGSGTGKPLKEYVECVRTIVAPDVEVKYGAIPYSDKQVMHLVADISDLIADTGYTPETNFANGVNKVVENA